MRTDTSIADLVRCEALAPDDAARARLYQMFGVTPWVAPRPVTPTATTPTSTRVTTSTSTTKPPPDVATSNTLPSTLQESRPLRDATPWKRAPTLSTREPTTGPPPRPALLPASRYASLAKALASVDREGDELDVDAAVATIAAGRPIVTAPRRRIRRVGGRVQLLLDRGEPMQPYALDLDDLAHQLRRVVGRDAVHTWAFTRNPLGEHVGGRWVPPALGSPIIVASDLAIGGPAASSDRATTQEWVAFAARAREAGCPVVVMCPFPRERLPRRLAIALRCIEWDRTTTARAARR